jgi:molybdopterin converting factor small subunit
VKVRVKGFLMLRTQLAAHALVELPENSTLRDLLAYLPAEILQAVEARDTDINSLRKQGRFAVLVNGMHYTHLPEQLDTRLKDEDEVAIFPPIAGG